jgi:transcriptional regulator with XRE-family HTH domain
MIQSILTKVNQKRLEKNYSQQYMASRLKISQSYYNKIESGKKTITLQHILQIASILDIEITDLFGTNKSA